VVLLLLLSGRFTIDDESASGSWKTNDCQRGEPGLAITIFSHYILFIPLSLSLSLSFPRCRHHFDGGFCVAYAPQKQPL
jgi:hypothetical protein